ncbi:MAG TPA: hypothetical protein VFF14_10440 [Candidatus Deferrimicrobium sp.]|nr:hypothetical protein [Candidatus Deferrimicrobium sp.]
MTFIFGLGLVLIVLFSVSVACYFVYFKSPIKNSNSSMVKATATFVLGLVVFALTFACSIILVWPPYLWSIIE